MSKSVYQDSNVIFLGVLSNPIFTAVGLEEDIAQNPKVINNTNCVNWRGAGSCVVARLEMVMWWCKQSSHVNVHLPYTCWEARLYRSESHMPWYGCTLTPMGRMQHHSPWLRATISLIWMQSTWLGDRFISEANRGYWSSQSVRNGSNNSIFEGKLPGIVSVAIVSSWRQVQSNTTYSPWLTANAVCWCRYSTRSLVKWGTKSIWPWFFCTHYS